MEILLGIIVILLVISNVYLMIAMQRQNRKPEINPQIEEIRREVVGLQRMFTGVKTRGIWGEWQLGSILDETLTPDQYETECMVIPGRTTRVEYAVKLPGRYEEPVYLPIDSKFPLDAYLQYEEALQSGNREMAEDAAIVFKNRVKSFAKDIHDKYILPPYTTDFAVLFFPIEAIYVASVKLGLAQELMRLYKVTMASPASIGVLLNSLQMGFRTLAIQKRTGEVWTVLGAVKTEFSKFGGLLEKVQKNLQNAGDQLEEVMGKRTRAIERKLRQVEQLPHEESQKILPIDDGDDE